MTARDYYFNKNNTNIIINGNLVLTKRLDTLYVNSTACCISLPDISTATYIDVCDLPDEINLMHESAIPLFTTNRGYEGLILVLTQGKICLYTQLGIKAGERWIMANGATPLLR